MKKMKNFKLKKVPKDNLENQIKVWEKTIDVQMHFNELQMKIRNFAVLIISALVGVAGIALKDRVVVDQYFLWIHFHGSLSSVFFGVAAITWLAFFFMDQHWYYPLLIGAVKHGAAIEASLKDKIPSIGLTTRIGEESPQKLWKFTLRSKDKSFVFYTAIFLLLLVLSVGTAWVPVTDQNEKQQASAAEKKLSTLDQKNAPTTILPPAITQSQSPGTTVILNQELYAGAMPVQKSQYKKIKTTLDEKKKIIEKCISPEPICKPEPIVHQN